MNKRIAITGGIGSGKSTALWIVKRLGYLTLSSDSIVNELYKKHAVKILLKEAFPSAIKGNIKLRIDRKELAFLAFSSTENHQFLTNLITPLVMQEIDKLTTNKKGLVFIEVPLLFECKFENRFDKVFVITRRLDERINSVKKRSNLTERQILERIKRQVDYDNIDLSPFTVIQNDGDKQALKLQLELQIKELL